MRAHEEAENLFAIVGVVASEVCAGSALSPNWFTVPAVDDDEPDPALLEGQRELTDELVSPGVKRIMVVTEGPKRSLGNKSNVPINAWNTQHSNLRGIGRADRKRKKELVARLAGGQNII
ncbi:hypothetical protein B0H14DRAFT_2567389 [Mycena olivaceomarginata]|nr:hypothetical protein B0H14DRAFT_2567389 [Mycena olivaceomarginata]